MSERRSTSCGRRSTRRRRPVAAFGPTPEQLRAKAAEAERLAKENGTPSKSSAVIKSLARR